MKTLQDYKKRYDGLTCTKSNLKGEEALKVVTQIGSELKYVTEQTDEICLAAVRIDGHSLRFVKNQTEEICLVAVTENGFSLKYVKDQTEEICLAAILETIGSLEYVNEDMFYKGCIEVTANGKTVWISKSSAESLGLL